MRKGKVHINEQEWKYEIYSSGIKIRHPSGVHSWFIDMPNWTGWTWHALERAKWKKSEHPAILPSEIKQHIEKYLCSKK